MKTVLALALLASISTASFAPEAHAVGCFSGAAVGGVAGHVAGHHAILGAIGGCLVGHHMNKVQKQRDAAQAQQGYYAHPNYALPGGNGYNQGPYTR